jgi:hypothetical protein
MPGTRLGAGVYTFNVGDKLERDQVTNPDELLAMVSTGDLESSLPRSTLQDDGSVKVERMPKALHNKYYKSMSGFCDTPKDVVESIKRSLCAFDDTYSRCSPQTVVSICMYF